MDLNLPSTTTTLLLFFIIYILYKLFSFIYFYILAVRTGFPIYTTPIFHKSILWLALGPVLQPQLEKWLPRRIYLRWFDLIIHGWDFRRRFDLKQIFGRGNKDVFAFVLVSPDGYSLYVCDPPLSSAVLQRRKDFVQAPAVKQFIGIFGENVLQANGEDWQRQRRIIAPNLNETIMATVWKESCHQAQDMATYMLSHSHSHPGGGGETLGGLRSIAINVLGKSGYGRSHTWSPDFARSLTSSDGEENWSEDDSRVAYFKTIALVTSRFLAAVLVPARLKKMPFMPKSLQFLGRQMDNVPRYINEIFKAEAKKHALQEEGTSRNHHNMLDMLLQYSGQEKKSSGPYLTDDEISGNLWVFTSAGFDTSANTLGYAVMLLAAYPEYQDWVREELNGLNAEVTQWEYADVFSRCPRVLAVMFETLRLFSPVSHSMRCVNGPQHIADANGTHALSSPMDVFLCHQIIHLDASIWGADVAEFKPTRWIHSTTNQLIKQASVKDIFLPWSSGPRICPGMKMAQVEFVATIATLFRHATCEPLPVGGIEDPEELRGRLKKMMDESVVELTLLVKNPQEVQLRWVRT